MNKILLMILVVCVFCGSDSSDERNGSYYKRLNSNELNVRLDALRQLRKEDREYILSNVELLNRSLLSNVEEERNTTFFIISDLFQKSETRDYSIFDPYSPRRYNFDSQYLQAVNTLIPWLCDVYNMLDVEESCGEKVYIIHAFIMMGIYNEKAYQIAVTNVTDVNNVEVKEASIILLGHYGVKAEKALPIIKKYKNNKELKRSVKWSCDRIADK